MRSASLAKFFSLLTAQCGPHVFNPWTQRDQSNDGTLNGPAARCERLRAHLSVRAAQILIGEASGYQGCRVTGIAFTSERLVMAGAIPRVTSHGARLSTRHLPWSEPSATTVWNALRALQIEHNTILWNAFPWHPYQPHNPQSNRTPTRAERDQGCRALAALLSAAPHATVFAVGRHAQLALNDLGCSAIALRHPSMGGATLFCQGLRRALRQARRH